MIIGVDIDCTIISTVKTLLQLHYEDTGERVDFESITEYDISQFVSPEYRESIYTLFGDKRLYDRVELIDGCVDIIKKLIDEGHEIYFVTTTSLENMILKLPVLEKAFPFMDVRRHVITTYDKHLINVDVLIDDCLDNFGTDNYYGVLIDKPWNRNSKYVGFIDFMRVHNWDEVYREIQDAVIAEHSRSFI